jgi:hypothetical protein
MGKTALATNIAFNVAKAFRTETNAGGEEEVTDGAIVGFFSLEMSSEQLATRIVAEQAQISSEKIRRGLISEDEFHRLVKVTQELQALPLFIDHTGGITIAQLAARARKLKRQRGLGLLVVDYLQLLAGSKRSSDNRVNEITEITTGLKALAKELHVPVIALSQLSRQVENREDKRPQLSDCGAGPIVDLLEPHLPFRFVKVFHEPDGRFPNGVPNPMIEANRTVTIERLRAERADLGIAWDGDYDRCFFFDEQGQFIEGYYIVGLLAQTFLAKSPGERIVHDPRLTWNTLDLVRNGGGAAVQSKSGHAFIKQRMREVDAVYGGEMSAHHYFRDFSYADSGMIPWLLITEIMSRRGVSLSTLVGERMRAYPASGEINRKVQDAPATIASVKAKYTPTALAVDYTDGLSVEYREWRFNLRSSNTEPLLRLNVESRGDEKLMRAKTAELLELLGGEPG